ncbi:hypothetical protein WJX74_010866 [Apatococcus lobatus]|uniref:CW-type domain-containing protein n=1 Tax=Apatococcus lobatus TaxID=904363 RepID=A0AAW1SHY9_9CHLO
MPDPACDLGLKRKSARQQGRARKNWAVEMKVEEAEEQDAAVKRRRNVRPSASATARNKLEQELSASTDRWEQCSACGEWTSLGQAAEQTCQACSATVFRHTHKELQTWILCELCGKWRTIPAATARYAEGGGNSISWTCSLLRPGATCRTSANDWGATVRRAAAATRRVTCQSSADEMHLAQRLALPGDKLPIACSWSMEDVPSMPWLEYVPGRDTFIEADQLAAGVHAWDASSGEHILSTIGLTSEVVASCGPFILRMLELFRAGLLPVNRDGRASAGPIDIKAFLGQPEVAEQVRQAQHRRTIRLRAAGKPQQEGPQQLRHVVHISTDMRKVWIGDAEGDRTMGGRDRMDFAKEWRSNSIQSWAGGLKLADMPGARPNEVVSSSLSMLLAAQEPSLLGLVNEVWRRFAADQATRAAAERMAQATAHTHFGGCLGISAWNAYSVNIDYRTACHVDGKNMPGSYSALVILEVGPSFCGCFYMLPQYHVALDLKQEQPEKPSPGLGGVKHGNAPGLLGAPGNAMLHRSGDQLAGVHGNTSLWKSSSAAHRIALVLYQTDLKLCRSPFTSSSMQGVVLP